MRHIQLTPAHPLPRTGFALITGLLFLVVMSLIGISMMNVTRLETMMAGGTREANIAFQATETALRDGENLIDATATISGLNALSGTLSVSQDEPDFFAATTWTDTSSSTISSDYPEMDDANQPRRIIKHVGDFVDDATEKQSIAISGYTQGETIVPVSVFRVTARGMSRDSSAETLLQSNYGRRYGAP